MNEQNEAREALADAIVTTPPAEDANHLALLEADAAIAWLWSRADDPAVVEGVAKVIFEESWQGMLTWEEEQGSSDIPEMLEDADRAVRATLTALLGPRPESEASNATN